MNLKYFCFWWWHWTSTIVWSTAGLCTFFFPFLLFLFLFFYYYYFYYKNILGKHCLIRQRSALPANPTSSHPRSWSLGNATLVVAERSGWRRVLGASKPRPSAKGAHPYRKRACLEALMLATTKLTQRGMAIHPEDTLPNSESPEEAQDWFTNDN